MLFRRRWGALRGAALALLVTLLAACADEPGPTVAVPAEPGAPAAPEGPAFALSGACVVTAASRTYGGDAFADLNDFGRILSDADNAGCAANAAGALADKLRAIRSVDYDWFGDEWIDGNYVAMVLAAGDRIGYHGHMTAPLDSLLDWAASSFQVVGEPLNGCGLEQTDNCMDGTSAAAAAYGWIAAYRYRHNDPQRATAARNAAYTYIDLAFSSVCLRRVTTGVGPLCENGSVTPAMIRTGEAYTWSWNAGFQFPAYGFGLVTSIAAAILGIEGSGQGYSMSQPNRDVAVGLFEEIRRVVDAAPSPDVWKPCVAPTGSGSSWNLTSATTFCGGDPPYQPEMYALRPFYQAEVGYTPPTTGYPSSYFRASHFDLSTAAASRPAWFGYGRYVFYGELGYSWWTSRRPYMPMDAYQPKGYLERVDGGRMAHGWACDPDVPSKAVRVELRVAGSVVTGLANQPSDGAITTECQGGSAHRFSIQLPGTVPVGSPVSARTLDYTYGYTDLACSQAGTCVVPATPTVQVVWVQPAEASWGQPNTLTAAGHASGGTGGVKLEWRDVTFTSNPSWITIAYEAPLDANNSWSNTVPTPYDCHTIQVRATYFGVTTPTFIYYGKTSVHCTETTRMIWIQPSSTAGFGPPGSLVVAGEAKGAPDGTTVAMYYRNVSLGQSTFTRKNYDAPVDANGIWLNDIPNANPAHVYEVYGVYDVMTTNRCTYSGNGANNWC